MIFEILYSGYAEIEADSEEEAIEKWYNDHSNLGNIDKIECIDNE